MITKEESVYSDGLSASYVICLLNKDVMKYKEFHEMLKGYISEVNAEIDENDQMINKVKSDEKNFIYAYVACRLEEETEEIFNLMEKIKSIVPKMKTFRRYLRHAECFIGKNTYKNYYNSGEEVLKLSKENYEELSKCLIRSNSQHAKYIDSINSVPNEIMEQMRENFAKEKEDYEEYYEEDEFDKLEAQMIEEEDYL